MPLTLAVRQAANVAATLYFLERPLAPVADVFEASNAVRLLAAWRACHALVYTDDLQAAIDQARVATAGIEPAAPLGEWETERTLRAELARIIAAVRNEPFSVQVRVLGEQA